MTETVKQEITRRRLFRSALASGLAAIPLLAACAPAAAPTPAAPKGAEPTRAPAVVSTAAPAAAAPPTAAPAAKAAEPTKAPAAAAAATPVPVAKGVLKPAFDADPITFDAHNTSALVAFKGFEHVYESLVAFDDDYNIVPSLAESWQISPDGTEYVFKLDPRAKFHDGSELTAEDVKWTIDRAFTQPIAAPRFASLDGSPQIVDKKTVKLRLKKPDPTLLGEFAQLRWSMIYPKGADEKFNIKTKAIGTGPFKLKEYVPYDRIVYERFADYRIPGIPRVEEMTAKLLVEEDARIAALRSGAIDYANISPEGAKRMAGVRNINVLTASVAELVFLALPGVNSQTWKHFLDLRVRQAVGLALDREAIRSKVYDGEGLFSSLLAAAGFGDYALPEADFKPFLKRDVPKARELMAAAGYPDGKGFPVVPLLARTQQADHVAVALVLKESLREIGITVDVQPTEEGAVAKLWNDQKLDFNVHIWSWRPDPHQQLYSRLHGSSDSVHAPHTRQKELDDLLDKAATWVGPASQRVELYRKVQLMAMEEPLRGYPLVTQTLREALPTYVKGYTQDRTTRRRGLWKVSIEK